MGLGDWFKPKRDFAQRVEPQMQPMNESLTAAPSAFVGSFAGANGIGNINAGFGFSDAYGLEGNFIGDSFFDTGGVFGRPFGQPGLLEVEKGYIMHQRAISLYPEVAIGIEEIMRDLFVKDDPFTLVYEKSGETPEEDKENGETFDKVKELYDIFVKKPFTIASGTKTPDPLIIFNFLKQAYIDGRIAILSILVDPPEPAKSNKKDAKTSGLRNRLNESLVHWDHKHAVVDYGKLTEDDITELLESNAKALESDEVDSKGKVRIFVPIDPVKINEDQGKLWYVPNRAGKIALEDSQIIQSDFGLFDIVGARHGFLLYAFKYANQLQSLQDMLIPMRFRRSVARRVFNVDVANMPQNRAVSYMREMQNKFKYKKTYDASSGKIVSKTDEPTGIVEDYWFANRSGSKGTTVDTIDEAGNFQDSLDDIMYFNKKLYQSMFIPLRRIFESDASYDYTANSIEVDELRFVNFLDRIRFVYNGVLTQMFQQILKDNGIEDVSDISITLNYEAWYEKAKVKEDFEKALDLYESAKPVIGKLMSAETVINRIFDMTSSDVADEFEKIKNEIVEDSPYYPIYKANAEEESAGY